MVDKTQPKRRSVLKTIGAGTVTFAGLSGSVNADDGYTTIVTDVYKGKAIATAEVPTDWYEYVGKVRAQQENLRRSFGEESWLVSVSRKIGDRMIEGKEAHVLELGVTNADKVPDAVPSHINEIPVEIVEREPPEPEACDDGLYSCLEGGAAVTTEDQGGSMDGHSGTIIAEHPSYSESGFLTCVHGMGSCGDSVNGHRIDAGLGDDRELIGYVDEWGWDLDWAWCTESSFSAVDGLADEVVPYSYQVSGHVTEDGVDNMMSEGEQAEKYGMATCQTMGEVDRIANWEYCDEGAEDWVVTEANSDGGDSGGVHFRTHHNFEIVSIIGVHHGSTSNAWAGAAYRLNDKYGLEFGGTDTC